MEPARELALWVLAPPLALVPMAAGRGLLVLVLLVLAIVAIVVWLASHRRRP